MFNKSCITIAQRLFQFFCKRRMIIFGTYLFLQSLKCLVELLYNIGSTTASYDRRTVFFIQLVLRSFNDWFYLFYLPVVKGSFVSNPFRCYDCWMIVLNDPFFSHRMIIFDEPFSQSLNNHSNDRFLRFLMDLYEGPIFASNSRLRSFSISTISLLQRWTIVSTYPRWWSFNDFFWLILKDRFQRSHFTIVQRSSYEKRMVRLFSNHF